MENSFSGVGRPETSARTTFSESSHSERARKSLKITLLAKSILKKSLDWLASKTLFSKKNTLLTPKEAQVRAQDLNTTLQYYSEDGSPVHYEKLNVQNSKNQALDAHFFKANNSTATCPRILVMGGVGDKCEDLSLGVYLAHKYGAEVVLFSYRGYGRSEGRVTDLSGLVEDTHATLAAFRQKSEGREELPNRPITVLAHSMGGLLASEVAQTDPHLNLMAIKPPSSFTDVGLGYCKLSKHKKLRALGFKIMSSSGFDIDGRKNFQNLIDQNRELFLNYDPKDNVIPPGAQPHSQLSNLKDYQLYKTEAKTPLESHSFDPSEVINEYINRCEQRRQAIPIVTQTLSTAESSSSLGIADETSSLPSPTLELPNKALSDSPASLPSKQEDLPTEVGLDLSAIKIQIDAGGKTQDDCFLTANKVSNWLSHEEQRGLQRRLSLSQI